MGSRNVGIAIALVALAAAVGLFFVLRDDDPEPAAFPPGTEGAPAPPGAVAPAVPEIEVRDGRPVDGVAELTFRQGDQVRFAVRSDADDELHVHGYDIVEDLEAGVRTVVTFRADLDGVFEVELHDAGHVEIARLTIRP